MRARLGYTLVVVWVIFTVSLSAWWAWFAWHQVGAMMLLDGEHAQRLARYQRMLFWEGISLFLSLIGGGVALAWLIFKERKESERMREFFAFFAHELKTPLSSLRLQAEVLSESLKKEENKTVTNRLLSDLGRLYFRLENSLFLASAQDAALIEEEVQLSDLLSALEDLWPSLNVRLETGCMLRGDRRAFEVIFGNLLQNAVLHGGATEVDISVFERSADLICLTLHDNGTGYLGDKKTLGKLFVRPSSQSGSGIGLYLVNSLSRRMGGFLSFPEVDKGFSAEITLCGRIS